eukprot:TRINITY_DN21790_c0_g1_i1.p1 TRINITY_DN21790_c0_g1~~TRINITY_DN21790_c0_g1_i1.p1  ORF type:complete len:155 (+),score=38.55 TRINITY_DN21790_c0_g1_i1:28-465(+)
MAKPNLERPKMTNSAGSTVDEFGNFFFVRIPRTAERVDQAGKKYTVYEVTIENNANEWKVEHRFSEFDDLYKILCQKFPGQVPDFPSASKLLGHWVDQTESRRVQLEKFLNDLLMNAVFMFQCDDLQKFLQVPEIQKPKRKDGDK